MRAYATTDPAGDPAWIAFANALPCIAYSLTPDGRIEFINDRWTELTGHPAAVVLGDAWAAVVHPEDLVETNARLRTGLARGDRYDFETRIRAADGSYRTMRSSARPLRDAAGTIERWFGTLVDVEDRFRMVAMQADAETRLATFLETLPQIVWTADRTGWIDWYNQRWFDFTGQTREEAAGWGWQAAHHPEDFPRVMEAWPRSIETGEPFEMEFRLRRYDGIFHWFLTRIVPARDADGRVLRWYGSNTDIEEQRRALARTSAIAHTLQEAFLPENLPSHPDLLFDAVYVPAESEALVGGDWYDAIELPGGAIVVSVGDVSGHGVGASVSVGRLRQAIVFAALDRAEPASILARVNRVLRFQEATIATCVVAVIDPLRRTFSCALAGHPPPIVAELGRPPRILPFADAPPLGVVDDFVATTRTFALAGDTVVAFYTDGVTEFDRDIEGAEARLLAATGEAARDVTDVRPASTIRRRVMGDAASPDDVALLIVRCFPSAVRADLETTPATPLVKKWRFHSSDARTARASRRELMAFLEPLAASSDDLYTAELVLGEMLANTVEHAPGLVEITLDWRNEFPTLVARDSGPGFAAPLRMAAPGGGEELSEDGRGLFLIAALSREFSIESEPGGGTRLVAKLSLVKRGT